MSALKTGTNEISEIGIIHSLVENLIGGRTRLVDDSL